MGAIEAHVNASKPASSLKSSIAVQLPKASSGGCAKPPRVIHTYSPRVYKIQPEEFLELVQKLTGNPVAKSSATKPPRTLQFFGTDASKSNFKTDLNSHADHADLAYEFASRGEVLETPSTILGALPSPRLVTLNFLPLLSATPKAKTN